MSEIDLKKSLNDMTPAERRKQLLALKQQANKDAERPNLLVFADEISSPNFLRRPTGIAQIDIDLGGGFPAGTVNYVSGPENAGKTWLLFKTYAMHQRLYGPNSSIMHCQIEGPFDYFFLRNTVGYKIAIPTNLIEEHQEHRKARKVPLLTKAEVKELATGIGEFLMLLPTTMEEMIDWILETTQRGLAHIIGVDSIAAAEPSAEAVLNTLTKSPQQGAHATLMKRFLQHFYPLVSGSRGLNETTLIFINQVIHNRDKANAAPFMQKFIKDWKPAGSPAAKHGKTLDLLVWSGAKIREKGGKKKDEDGEDEKKAIIGKDFNWEVVKGKLGTHDNIFGKTDFYYTEDSLTQNLKSIMLAGMKYGVLKEEKGKWSLLNATTGVAIEGLHDVEGFDIFLEMMRKDRDIELLVRRELLAGAGVACRYT